MTIYLRNNKLRALVIMAAFLYAAVMLTGCIEESNQTSGQVVKSQLSAVKPADKAAQARGLLVEGADLFSKLCTSCHGTGGNGRGSRTGPSLQRPELTYGRTPSSVTQSIRDGRPGGMPSFGHVFSPRQLEALSAYVLSLKK